MMKQIAKSRFQPYQFKDIVTFSTLTTQENPYTGIEEPIKHEEFKKRFAKVKQTLNQKYSVLGTQYENSFNIAIRHDKRLEQFDYLIATVNGVDYRIIDISFDNETYNSYDLLTLTKKEGNGNG